MVSEHETEFSEEEKQDSEEINCVIETTLVNLAVTAQLRGRIFDGENIISGLLYAVATFIAGHPDEKCQLKLIKDVPEALEIAYKACKKVGRGSPN
jgi:hypothetical protein